MNILLLLYWEFCKIGLFCVGGGYASLPWIQAAVVDDYHWITMTEFIDIFTISQMTPGPIGINAATFVGTKIAGTLGAIVATLGFVTPSLILCLLITYLMKKYGELSAIKGTLNGLRPAVVALICTAGLSFIWLSVWNTESVPTNFADFDIKGIIILVIAMIAVKKKVSVITLLFGSGVAGLVLGLLM
ncbi:chromate transporter [Anaerovibrio lipolyticus DSM 3074]|uniref:Chromate transporter n=2 Tax=Anaerovibrio lipolyticus TaxID=82374 RepID=A0A0B2JUW4_9FIRM|nr:chromate transporter [Anaerovibrio lipolyticus]KHM51459.1 chromate transporter [Anaerovibrio lipolyticus]SHI65237.1 chromate transporter [Anaerovibrio lipolyticus DSM 3074]